MGVGLLRKAFRTDFLAYFLLIDNSFLNHAIIAWFFLFVIVNFF